MATDQAFHTKRTVVIGDPADQVIAALVRIALVHVQPTPGHFLINRAPELLYVCTDRSAEGLDLVHQHNQALAVVYEATKSVAGSPTPMLAQACACCGAVSTCGASNRTRLLMAVVSALVAV